MNISQPSITFTTMLLCILAAIVFYNTQMPKENQSAHRQTHQSPKILTSTTTTPSISEDKLQLALTLLSPKQPSNTAITHTQQMHHVNKAIESSQSPTAKDKNRDDASSPFDVLPIASPSLHINSTSSQVTYLEEKLISEAYDGEWAPEMEVKARNTFRQASLKHSNITSADCRTSLCKISITHKDENAEQTFYRMLAPLLKNKRGKLVRHLNDNGRPSTTFYQFR